MQQVNWDLVRTPTHGRNRPDVMGDPKRQRIVTKWTKEELERKEREKKTDWVRNYLLSIWPITHP